MADGAITRHETFAAKVAIVAFAVIAALLVFALRHVLLLIFGAILIAVGLRGLAQAIERVAPIGHRASMAFAALLVLGVIGGAIWLLGAQIAAQIAQMLEALPGAWRNFRDTVSQTGYGAALIAEIENASGVGAQLGAFASRVGAYTMTFAGATLQFLLVIVAATFFALNPLTYRNGLLMLIPQRRRARIGEALKATTAALRRWLLGTLVSMLFLATVLTLGLWALGVPAPLALGVLAGLSQFVPIIGPVLASAPAILLGLSVSPETAIWVALLYLIASQIEANIVFPLILQRAVSLPPGLTLFSAIGFGLLLGPLGVLFSAPLTVAISVFVVMFYVRGVLGDEHAPIPGG